MKIRTQDLTGPALDWAVAKCEGPNEFRWEEHYGKPVPFCWSPHMEELRVLYTPSADWSQGGPIIDREKISTAHAHNGTWMAYIKNLATGRPEFEGYGPNPLIAAMRCFVASKLGDEIDVPEELV